jgi:hypothetical protein
VGFNREWCNGSTNDFNNNWSALTGNFNVELLKFGKRFYMPIPSQAETEGVETLRAASKAKATMKIKSRLQT